MLDQATRGTTVGFISLTYQSLIALKPHTPLSSISAGFWHIQCGQLKYMISKCGRAASMCTLTHRDSVSLILKVNVKNIMKAQIVTEQIKTWKEMCLLKRKRQS